MASFTRSVEVDTNPLAPNRDSSASSAKIRDAKSVPNASLTAFWKLKQEAKTEKLKIHACSIRLKDTSVLKINQVESAQSMAESQSAQSIPDYLMDFSAAFDESRAESLPIYCDEYALEIELLPGEQPPSGRVYSLSLKEEEALRKILQDGLKSGKIRPSKAMGACPVLFVKKPDGSLRMCVDYRRLNAVTKTLQSSLPLISDIFESVRGSGLYSKVDLKGAFNLLRIKEGSEPLTAFQTKFGTYEWTVIPFGLKNAPGHFQSVMQRILGDLIGKGLAVYIDDLLVYEPDPAQHRALLCEIFRRFLEHGLIVSLNKCVFEVPQIDFLGHTLSANGIAMLDAKVSAIADFPEPKNVKELQSFLGLTNYYRMFIPHYSHLTAPLTDLFKKDVPFIFAERCLEAFRSLKACFTQGSILAFPDQSKQFHLQTDASDFALGAALHQWDDRSASLRPVGFYNRKLLPAEMNYPIYDKELLAIKDALVHWRHLLIDTIHPVLIQTDHKNLTYFRTTQQLNRRQARWQEILADYDFVIAYLKGSDNVVADALSRVPTFTTNHGDPERMRNVSTLLPNHIFRDPSVEPIRPSVLSMLTASDSEREYGTHALPPASLEEIEVDAEDDPFNLDALRERITDVAGDEAAAWADPEITDVSNWPVHMFMYLKTNEIKDGLPSRYVRLIKSQKKNFAAKGTRLYKSVTVQGLSLVVPYLPKSQRNQKIKELHEVMGHLGTDSIADSLKMRYWWPMLVSDLKYFTEACETCQLNRKSEKLSQHPMHPLPPPGLPFYRWGIDFVQDLPETRHGNTNIVTAIDYATRMVVAKAVPNRDSQTVAKFLFEIMTRFGAPSEIVSDRGSCFMASLLSDYLAIQEVNHYPTTPYHPNTNGMVERMHSVLGNIITKMSFNAREKWDEFVPSAVFILNARKHSVTGFSPFYLAYGFNPRLPGDISPPCIFNLRDHDDQTMFTERELIRLGQDRAAALYRSQRQAQEMAKKHDANPRVSDQEYPVGSFVKVKNHTKKKFQNAWQGPFIVDRIGPHDVYYLKTPGGLEVKNPVNRDHLAPYSPGPDFVSEAASQESEEGGTVGSGSNT